jgi:arylsulfatase A-like enzyme
VLEEMTSNVDIAPTIAQLAGASPQRAQDGFSLVPLLTGEFAGTWKHDARGVLIHYIGFGTATDPSPVPGYWGVRTRRYKYVELSTGEKELYDLAADPWELENRAGQVDYSDIQTDLRQKLQYLKAK